MKLITDIGRFLSEVEDGEKIYDLIGSLRREPKLGRYEINDNCYVNVFSYSPKQTDFDGTFECHRREADVHFLIAGSEKLYYGERGRMTVVEDYDEATDNEPMQGKDFSFVEYSETEAVYINVGEPHMAGYFSELPEPIVKAVVKIGKF